MPIGCILSCRSSQRPPREPPRSCRSELMCVPAGLLHNFQSRPSWGWQSDSQDMEVLCVSHIGGA